MMMTYCTIATSVVFFLATLDCFAEEPFKVTTKRSNDRVGWKLEGNKATLAIHSPLGISDAIIERNTEQWPDQMVLQLRLTGLESFKLSTEKLRLEASLSSHNSNIRQWKDDKENALLDTKSPYWMAIRSLDSDGNPTKAIPLKDGCFEIRMPKKFFEGNPKSFKLTWIDFYRN